MKNLERSQLRKCAVFSPERFKLMLEQASNGLITADLDFGDNEVSFSVDELIALEVLSEFFDVKVTSIHLDGCLIEPLVWVVYR